MNVLQWIKWILWGWWHGESVSAFDVRRATQGSAPEVQVGSLRIPRWLIWALVVIVFLVLLVVLFRMLGIVLTTENALATQAGALVNLNACIVREQATGRVFVAVDCLVRQGAGAFSFTLAVGLAFLVGVATGWFGRGRVGAREG